MAAIIMAEIPDRKLMALTDMSPSASSTGLMITPPPMPQMPPIVDAQRHTAKIMKPIRRTLSQLRPFSSSVTARSGSRT